MYHYHCLNNISGVGLALFKDHYREVLQADEADAILVRSAKIKAEDLPDDLLAIARAGAGVNNIPIEDCSEKGIIVFNTPGANANGVKELVLAGLLLAARDIVGGVQWVREQEPSDEIAKLVEKQKKQFAGNEISGKKLGIIGLGAIGQSVANAAVHLGMEVYGYDPYISIDAAWNLSRSVRHVQDVRDIYRDCDFITIHVPLLDSTRGMIDKEAIGMMKKSAVLLNFARDVLVDEEAVVAALAAGRLKKYVSDFVNPTVMGVPGVIVTPHLGASTLESEDNCAKHAVRELIDFLERGTIRNSVNYPYCDMGPCDQAGRVAVCHRNIAGMITKYTKVFGDHGININDMTNKSKGDYAYTLMDLAAPATEEIADELRAVEGVLRVRIIK